MKNSIGYFYNLLPNKIDKIDDNYYFSYQNVNYVLIEYDNLEKINAIFDYATKLNYMGFYTNKIVQNKEQKLLTLIDNKLYVLISYDKRLMQKLNLLNIIEFNYPAFKEDKLDCTDWKVLWSKKLDFFEYQLNQSGINYPLLKESYSYFSGLTELAISLLNEVNTKDMIPVLAHNRLKEGSNIYSLYDPFNFVIDYKIRDVCEYIKSILLSDGVLNLIEKYIINRFSKIEISLFLIRLLYPSLYFDEFEQIISGKKEENSLKKIINNVDNYELRIKQIFDMLLPYSTLPITGII